MTDSIARPATRGVWGEAVRVPPAKRMPGVTITNFFPNCSRSGPISRAEATQPSSPATLASPASRNTWLSTVDGTPSSASSARRSRLVSTVTPRQIGRGTPRSLAAFVAASAAARIIFTPPPVWTLSMKTPRRVASRTAPATVLGMSWYFRSRNTRKPRLRAASTAAGPAAVKSWLPILQPVTTPLSVSSSAVAWSRPSTSSATSSRSAGSRTVILLQARHAVLFLEERLDRADGGLDAVHRQVVGDLLGDGRAADERGVRAGASVLGRVEDQRDLALLHQIDHVGAIAFADLVDDLDAHAVALQHASGAARRHQAEAHLAEALGQRHRHALVAVLHRDEDLAAGGQGGAGGDLRLEVGLAKVAVDAHDLAGGLHLGTEHDVHARELNEGEDRLLHRDVVGLALLDVGDGVHGVAQHRARRHLG